MSDIAEAVREGGLDLEAILALGRRMENMEREIAQLRVRVMNLEIDAATKAK